MNKLIIIGALGKDPETRTTPAGINVCSFSVGVSDRKAKEPTTTWFKVTAWRQLADICQKFLTKGKKVCVVGSVSASAYEGKDGKAHASLDVTADDIEFLSPKAEDGSAMGSMGQNMQGSSKDQQSGFTQVDEDELPF